MAKEKKISKELYEKLISNGNNLNDNTNVKKISKGDYESLINRQNTVQQTIAPVSAQNDNKNITPGNLNQYKDTGKTIGNYINNSSLKNAKIYSKDNKFYYYDDKNKKYEEITNKTGYEANKVKLKGNQIAPISEHYTNKTQSETISGSKEDQSKLVNARKDKLGLADRLKVDLSNKSDKGKKQEEKKLIQEEKNNQRVVGVVKGLEKKGYIKAGTFDDGYQAGDISKTIGSTILSGFNSIGRGAMKTVEGIADTTSYILSGVEDKLGFKDLAETTKEFAKENLVDKITVQSSDAFYGNDSILGGKSDSIVESIGGILPGVVTGSLASTTKGATAITSGTTFASSYGQGAEEAYANGATDEEAQKYGLISGIAETSTEMMFGGLGKGSKALGVSKSAVPVDDAVAKAVSSKFKSALAKNLSEATIKMSGEGLEEVASGIIQGIGKKLTFESDKDLNDILKDENLLDQFIGGAVASGVMQSPYIIKSTKENRDYLSGYTDNEQKVLDNIVESRFNEKIKENPEMSQKEQNNLREEIETNAKKDLDNGNLSISEINEALGNDDYLNLQNAERQKSEIEKQLKELQNKSTVDMPYSEYNENNQKIKDLQKELKNINFDELKSKANTPIENRIQDNDYLLQNSYNNYQQNQNQKGVNFKYEPQTDKKGKQIEISDLEKNVYNSASKVMNNTKESHNLANFVSKLSKDTGVKYEFTNNEGLKNSGYNVSDDLTINGLNTDDGKILINIDSNELINKVVGHETTHLFENTEEYKTLQNDVFEYAKTKGDFEKLKSQIEKNYQNVKGANIDNEVTSELLGKYLFSDEQFINNLSKNKNVFEKIFDKIKHIYNMATAGSKEAKQLEKVKYRFEQVYKENIKNKLTQYTKYSIQEDSQGNKYVNVDTNQDIFKGKNLYEQNKIAKQYILDNFKGKILPINEENVRVTRTTVNEYTHPRTSLQKKDVSSKMKASTELDNLLSISKYKYSKSDDGRHSFAKDGWDYYETTFKVGDNIYTGLVNIAKNGDKKMLYDITNLKRNTLISSPVNTATESIGIPFSNTNVSQSNNNVKSNTSTKYSISKSENNTENSNASSFSLDSNAKRYNELLKTNYIEYFRKDNGDVRVSLLDSNNNLVNQLDLWSNTDAISQFGERLGNQLYNYAVDNNQKINIGNDINNLGLETDYFMNHRPTESGITADNLINQNVETPMPEDMYDHPEWYFQMNEKSSQESVSALRKIRGKPNAEITIYRATPGNKINRGDWVTLSKAYAEWHNQSQFDGKGNILEMKVKAKDIQYAGDDINEFGYFPQTDIKYSLSQNNKFTSKKEINDEINKLNVLIYNDNEYTQDEKNEFRNRVKELKELKKSFNNNIAPIEKSININTNNGEFDINDSTTYKSYKLTKNDISDIDAIVNKLINAVDDGETINQSYLDDEIENVEILKNLKDEDIDIDDYQYNILQKVQDEIFDKLYKSGIEGRIDEHSENYVYDRRELAEKGYDNLLKYLNKNNIKYEVSRSTEAGYVPSIYIKDSDGETIFRIGNHDNGYVDDYDMVYNESYNHIFKDTDYINWKENIIPEMEKNIGLSNGNNISIDNEIKNIVNENISAFEEDGVVESYSSNYEDLIESIYKDVENKLNKELSEDDYEKIDDILSQFYDSEANGYVSKDTINEIDSKVKETYQLIDNSNEFIKNHKYVNELKGWIENNIDKANKLEKLDNAVKELSKIDNFINKLSLLTNIEYVDTSKKSTSTYIDIPATSLKNNDIVKLLTDNGVESKTIEYINNNSENYGESIKIRVANHDAGGRFDQENQIKIDYSDGDINIKTYNLKADNSKYSLSKTSNNLKKTPFDVTSEDVKITKQLAPVNKILNPVEISKLKPTDASTTPKIAPIKVQTGKGKSHFFDNIKDKTNMLSEKSKEKILSEKNVEYYKEVTNEESLDKAFEKLETNGSSETLSWFNKPSENATDVDVAEGWILMKQYEDAKDYDGMVQVAKKMRDIGTKAGQTVQAFNIMNRLTPEGMVKYAQSELMEAYDKMVKNKTKDWIDKYRGDFELKPEEVQFIMDNMVEVSKLPDGYEKRVKLAEIQKLMSDKLPPEKGAGIKSWMRISMLFNPKTQVRNVLGNALIAPVNAFGDLFAGIADKLVSKKTGVRTVGNINLKKYGQGMKKGLFESYNDFKKGINTRNIDGNRFEIGEGKSFNEKHQGVFSKQRDAVSKSLNRVDHLLSFMLDAGDRMFYEGSFVNSINNQMVLNKTENVTQEMIDIATKEALSRTWQDNNGYTDFVLDVRRKMNKISIGHYGLGDILIPFAKTPANLTKALVDYSPVGLISTINKGKNIKNALKTGQFNTQMQHEFVQSLGKATAGTALYILGLALAKSGIISGESDEDKDVSNFMKNTLGVNSYSIKIGDRSFTYDWAQPLAGPFSIMANLANKESENASFLEKFTSTFNTAGNLLIEQSFMESINTVLSNNDGLASGIEEAILGLPSRAVPTFMKQIADLVDGTQRTSFEYNKPLESALNSVKTKIPFISKTLAPSVDTLGREIQKYGGENNVFNVMFSPANINISNTSESAKEIYRVYNETGDATVMPRVAPYYVMNNGEKILLSSKQREFFQKKSGKLIDENINKLTSNLDYQNATDEDKAGMISDIINYSYNIAQHETVETDIGQNYQTAYNFVNNGGDLEKYYVFKHNTGDKSSTEKEQYLYESDIDPEQKTLLYENVILSDFDDADKYKKYKASKQFGIDINSWLDYSSQEFASSYDENGNTVKNSKKNQLISYVKKLNLNSTQKAFLIKMNYSNFKDYDNQLINKISTLDVDFLEKAKIIKTLGFDAYDNSIINYVNTNYSSDERNEVLKNLGFKIIKSNGRTYIK